ncbi:MAG: hypothetical protein IKH13_03700 [Clostridia bacterium]|nr:hypothetical protein [Clostridia bacterium]
MSINDIIMLLSHIDGFIQEVTAHIDDFNLIDPAGTIQEILGYASNFFGYLFQIG